MAMHSPAHQLGQKAQEEQIERAQVSATEC